jgi:hypothetical protein
MRRGLIALLAAGLVLVAGVAAAAAAGGSSPMDLFHAKPAKQPVQRPRETSSASRVHVTSSTPARPSGPSAKEEDDQADNEDKDSERGPPSQEPAAHKVMLCHHTGSWKHPFHAISVDEHAVTAHTAHGDTLGACSATPADGTPPTKHEKQISPMRPHPGNRGRASEHRGRGHDK